MYYILNQGQFSHLTYKFDLSIKNLQGIFPIDSKIVPAFTARHRVYVAPFRDRCHAPHVNCVFAFSSTSSLP